LANNLSQLLAFIVDQDKDALVPSLKRSVFYNRKSQLSSNRGKPFEIPNLFENYPMR
jgi:hypothetical protein